MQKSDKKYLFHVQIANVFDYSQLENKITKI